MRFNSDLASIVGKMEEAKKSKVNSSQARKREALAEQEIFEGMTVSKFNINLLDSPDGNAGGKNKKVDKNRPSTLFSLAGEGEPGES